MKILHCTTHDAAGGAAVAARRLHLALCAAGEESCLAVARKHVDSAHTVLVGGEVTRRVVRPILSRGEQKISDFFYTRPSHPAYTTFSFLPSLQHRRINVFPKDILHLHWVGEGFLSPWAIAGLQGPVVWTMHDTWPFTGGCHFFASGCERYRKHCGRCPELCSKRNADLSYFHWQIKRRAIVKLQPVFVSPSADYMDKARSSGMLQGCRIEHIPNCIDTKEFRPIDRQWARELLALPSHARILLFGAMGASSDRNKGFDLLCKSLQMLDSAQFPDTLLLVFGASGSEAHLPFPVHFLGRLHDSVTLALAYSAADVFVCPSRQENLPNTIMESLACGTPVAAFSVGGIPDMVEHKVNGYLAPPQDTESLAQGIAYLLKDDERRARMGEAARRVVEERYAAPVVAAQYKKLYADVLESLGKP